MSLRRPNFDDDKTTHEINVSPLLDVVFNLLFFFVVTMVFSEKSVLDIERPNSIAAESVEQGSFNIFISADGRLSFDGRPQSIDSLRDSIVASSKKVAVIDADANLELARLVEVMDVCKESGIERLLIAADRMEAAK